LRKNLTRSNSFNKDSTQIANQRSNEVARLQRIGGADRRGFLAQRAKNTANNFCLPVEIYKSLFNQSR
jgi:hypothetical protein